MAIAFFYAVGTLIGGTTGPLLFADLTSSGKVSDTVIAFVIGASLMCAAGLIAIFFAVDAEQKGLEDIARPLTATGDGTLRRRSQRRFFAVQQRFVEVDGNRIAYLECGDPEAPAVVLIHGLLSDSETWLDDLQPLADARRARDRRRPARARRVRQAGRAVSPGRLRDLPRRFPGRSAAEVGDDLRALARRRDRGALRLPLPGAGRPAVLVSAGGLGREVSLALRLLSLPGVEWLTGAVMGRRLGAADPAEPADPPAVSRHAGTDAEPAPRRPLAVPARLAPGLLPLAARRDRATRSARVVHRDGVPRRAPADVAGLGATGRDHPGRACAQHARPPARQRTGRVPRRRPRAAPPQRRRVRERGRGVRRRT